MIKKSTIAALGLAVGVMVSCEVYANESYIGGGVGILEYSEDGFDGDFSLTALYGRLGTNFNENFSGEIRVGVGLGDDSVDVFGTNVNVELDSMFGAYIKGGVPVSEAFFPYVILGYTRGEITASAPGYGSDSESESDVSFGLGADVDISNSIILNFEYINYFDKNGAEISGFSLGLVKPF